MNDARSAAVADVTGAMALLPLGADGAGERVPTLEALAPTS